MDADFSGTMYAIYGKNKMQHVLNYHRNSSDLVLYVCCLEGNSQSLFSHDLSFFFFISYFFFFFFWIKFCILLKVQIVD